MQFTGILITCCKILIIFTPKIILEVSISSKIFMFILLSVLKVDSKMVPLRLWQVNDFELVCTVSILLRIYASEFLMVGFLFCGFCQILRQYSHLSINLHQSS